MADELGTMPSGATVTSAEAITEGFDGWTSRKLIIAICSAGASMIGAFAFLWFGKISEPGAIELIEGGMILVGSYCGINLVEKLGGLLALVKGK